MINSKSTPPSEAASVIDKAGEQGPKMLAKIFAAAQPGAVDVCRSETASGGVVPATNIICV